MKIKPVSVATPILITGIHGDDLITVYEELCQIIDEVIQYFEASSNPLPAPRVRPMQDVRA